jgi:hypothetical protein
MTAPTNPSVSANQAIVADRNRIKADFKDKKYTELSNDFRKLMKDIGLDGHHDRDKASSKRMNNNRQDRHRDRDKASSAVNTQVCQGENNNGGKPAYGHAQRDAESASLRLLKGFLF